VSGIAIVANLLFSWYADWFKGDDGRTHVGIWLSITGLISGAIMLNTPSVNAKLFALFLNGVQLGFRSVLFAWANDICRKDDAKCAIVLGFMNAMSKASSSPPITPFDEFIAIAFYIFWTLCFHNTKQAPMWREGSIAMIANSLAMFLSVLSVAWFTRRDKKREALIEDLSSETASETVKVDIEENSKALDV
jgi:MFS transporter, ACS family, pantothenate transporter